MRQPFVCSTIIGKKWLRSSSVPGEKKVDGLSSELFLCEGDISIRFLLERHL